MGALRWGALLTALLLAGCTSTRAPAPVSDRTGAPAPAVKPAAPAAPAAKPAPAGIAREPDARPEFYTIKRGDTLYSIALDHGLDYRELAEWNAIDNPNVIRVGQQLRLRAPAATAVATPLKPAPAVQGKPVTGTPLPAASAPAAAEGVKTQPKGVKLPYSEQALAQLATPAVSAPAVVAPTVKPPAVAPAPKPEPKPEARADDKSAAIDDDDEKIDWGWPSGGKVLSTFNESTNLKGIGIAGKAGQPVLASAPGRVLYAGDGIRGYGKLVIVKHNKVFLSVYAHNSQILVKEGQNVVKGQKIAEMGNSDADQVKLHFEIRRFGKPVDPLKLLPPERG